MPKSDFKAVRFRRRLGFSLIEVALASVIGSALLISMIYTSREMNTAVTAVYDEAFLQTMVRDLGDNVDSELPIALAQFAATGGTLKMSMDKYSAPNASGLLANGATGMSFAHSPLALGALAVAFDGESFQVATAPTPTPTPMPTSTPTSAPTATPTPNPNATPLGPFTVSTQAPTYTQASGASAMPTPAPMAPASMPSYTQNIAMNNATMTLGNWRARYEDSPNMAVNGGKLMYTTASGAWKDMGSIGTRAMVQNTNFAYGFWQPPPDPAVGKFGFGFTSSAAQGLVVMTSKLGRSDGVPFILQQAWAPRALTWSFQSTNLYSNPTLPAAFPQPPYFGGPNGLFPVGVNEAQLINATRGLTTIDVWSTPAPGNFGWLSWDSANSQVYLDAELTNPNTQGFVDANNPGNTIVKPGAGAQGLPGIKAPGRALVDTMAVGGKVVTALVYNNVAGTGANSVYTVHTFANFQLTQVSATGATGSDYLKFLGWSDANGNLMPPNFTPF
jgi:hypothetical protein